MIITLSILIKIFIHQIYSSYVRRLDRLNTNHVYFWNESELKIRLIREILFMISDFMH